MYGLLYVIFTDVSAKEQTQILFTSESFPSSSVASHRTEGIYALNGNLSILKSTQKKNIHS